MAGSMADADVTGFPRESANRHSSVRQSLLMLCLMWFAISGQTSSRADGPADNLPAQVRRIPKDGISVPPDRAAALRAELVTLQQKLSQLQKSPDASVAGLLPDVMIFERAVRNALDHNEFFDMKDLDKADQLLKEGIQRADQLLSGQPAWPRQTGLVVRGYISRIDQTVQPYGLVIPETCDMDHHVPIRCDIWFHGRGETLSEVNFLSERMKTLGQFAPNHTIVLHPYGRYCNAFKFAGEVDVLEALEDVQKRYRIDEDRISVRGFSMGGAACWQFATHYPDRWFAANPGAGFSETPRFLNVFQGESLQPTSWEKTLWNLYDCDRYALNLVHCPTVAYSGELDKQKQAADVMEEALATWGIRLRHIIGAGMGHRYDDASKQLVEQGLTALAKAGRDTHPQSISFTTHTLKYNRMHWLTVDGLHEHWKPATIRVGLSAVERGRDTNPLTIRATVSNVSAFSLDFPSGFFPLTDRSDLQLTAGVKLIIASADQANPQAAATGNESVLDAGKFQSDGSLQISVHVNGAGQWESGRPEPGLRKRHDLQGPIDDAFMDSFVFVRPTGTATHAAAGRWAESELNRAVVHWRQHFRGDARVVNDTDVTDALIQSAHLILWGDPGSNAVLAKIAGQLPIQWTTDRIVVGAQSYPADRHAPVLICPNPLNTNRYVVLNSSFTFREYAYLNNARQVPMLPDWAIIDLTTPANSVWPGHVVAADFFDEHWRVKSGSP